MQGSFRDASDALMRRLSMSNTAIHHIPRTLRAHDQVYLDTSTGDVTRGLRKSNGSELPLWTLRPRVGGRTWCGDNVNMNARNRKLNDGEGSPYVIASSSST
jgi:hypothetical protein